jgi:hypothetical protein
MDELERAKLHPDVLRNLAKNKKLNVAEPYSEDNPPPFPDGAFDLGTGEQIPEFSNLNDYTTPGVYYCANAAQSATLLNKPTSAAFKLIVIKALAAERFAQIAIGNQSGPPIYKRYYNGVWSPWIRTLDENDLPEYPVSLENGGTGIAASTPIAAINALGGRTFYYENIASSNTVSIATTGLAGVALFFGGPAAARVGAYIVYFPNATSTPFVVPMAEASAITITPSAGMVTITAGVQLYMAVMCLYEATAGRLIITKT